MPDERFLIADLRESIDRGSDLQEMRQHSIVWSNEKKFQVCTNSLRHLIDAADVGQSLSNIAEAVIKGLYGYLVRKRDHVSAPPSAGIAVVALGALGRRELTPDAPLDLLFVMDDAAAEADTLASVRQFTSILNEDSEDGGLYKINGTRSLWNTNGHPILSLAEIRDGALDRQAPRLMASLCQARVIAGPPSLNDQIADAVHEILTEAHDVEPFVEGIWEASQETLLATGAGPWCIRERNGGLDDLEVLIRCLQLRNAHKTPAVLEVSPAVALATLARQGALAEDIARRLIDSHHLMRQLENMIIVTVGGAFDAASAPNGVKLTLARAAGVANFDELEPLLDQAAGQVESAAEELLKPPPG
jgi:glutamine synthetase adenylyltransferase